LSIILIILEAESFKLRRLTGLTAYVLPAWLTNLVAACGLAHSMAAYGGLRWRLWGLPTTNRAQRRATSSIETGVTAAPNHPVSSPTEIHGEMAGIEVDRFRERTGFRASGTQTQRSAIESLRASIYYTHRSCSTMPSSN